MKFDFDYGFFFVNMPVALFISRWVCRFLDTPTRLPRWDPVLRRIWLIGFGFIVADAVFSLGSEHLDDWYLFTVFTALSLAALQVREFRPARTLLVAVAPFMSCFFVSLVLEGLFPGFVKRIDFIIGPWWGFAVLWLVAFAIVARNQKKAAERERLKREEEAEAKRLIETQNNELERLVSARTVELTRQKTALEETLTELQATQAQLIQSEKMASLGELTAGIAHEIQNPLNFVNNFSEVSVELIDELEQEREKTAGRDEGLIEELLADLRQNLQKITYHGKRADGIVKGMLQHSRTSTGQKEPTDLNALADEYLRLSYHGLRAKDKSFNALLKTDFDPALGPVGVIPQDVGRVLLNLFNNAFHAVSEKKKIGVEGYQPTVTVVTKRTDDGVEIRVRDNGTGMPEGVKAKIFQPFFTTKPTGQGTGLGLSLSYDIVTKGHGGTLTVETSEGQGTEFIVRLPT